MAAEGPCLGSHRLRAAQRRQKALPASLLLCSLSLNISVRGMDETDVFRLVSSLNTGLKDKVEHKTIAKEVRREKILRNLQPGSANTYKTHQNKPQYI